MHMFTYLSSLLSHIYLGQNFILSTNMKTTLKIKYNKSKECTVLYNKFFFLEKFFVSNFDYIAKYFSA